MYQKRLLLPVLPIFSLLRDSSLITEEYFNKPSLNGGRVTDKNLLCLAELRVCSCVSLCLCPCAQPHSWEMHPACRAGRAATDRALFRLLWLIVDFLEAEGCGIKTGVEGLGDICYA